MTKYLFLVILTFISCGASKKKIELANLTSKANLNNTDCVESLRQKMHESTCENLRYAQTSQFDILLKCENEDDVEDNYYNSNLFRLSYANLAYTEEDQLIVDAHTICLDDLWRIEIYPPE